MKRLIALLLILTLLPLPGVFAAPAEEEAHPIAPEAYEAVAEDVWDDITAIEDAKVLAKRGTKATERDYVAIVDEVAAAVEASDTYVEDSLNRNGAFLTWETTEGVVCGYSPKMRQEARRQKTGTTAAPQEETISFATKNGPSSTSVTVLQPYYGIDNNFTDLYQQEAQQIARYMGGEYILKTQSAVSINALARALESSGVVLIDSHGDTDYVNPYNSADFTSCANTSYILLQTGEGLTSKDQGMVYGPYGSYYHAFYGGYSGYGMNLYYVDGTAISNHMKKSAPNNFVWNGVCLGMATDGIEAPLRKRGVGVVYGYSQSVTFANDWLWSSLFWDYMCYGYDVANAIAMMKEIGGYWDLSPRVYDYYDWYYDGDTAFIIEDAQEWFYAFPVVSSNVDYYPGHGQVDNLQTVWTDWTMPNNCSHTATYTSEVLPGCTVAGALQTFCNDCGMLLSSVPIDPTGHNFDSGVVTAEPTPFHPGEMDLICSNCEVTVSETIYYGEIGITCYTNGFRDMNVEYWYHPYTDYVLRNGLMNGISSKEFNPNGDLTRSMLVTILYRSAGQPSVSGMTHPFNDVKDGLWYSDAVLWAYNNGIVNGMSAHSFAPDAKITREQIVTILYRFNGGGALLGNLSSYSDGSTVSGYARDAMSWAVGQEIINGMDNRLAPQDYATRCQVAKILTCYLQQKEPTDPWISDYYDVLMDVEEYRENISYLLYDMDGNGIPELVIRHGSTDSDTYLEIYTWNGSRVSAGVDMIFTNTALAGFSQQGGLLLCTVGADHSSYARLDLDTDYIVKTPLLELDSVLPVDYLEMHSVWDLDGLYWTGNPADDNYNVLAPYL